jgi:hypothetical protein
MPDDFIARRSSNAGPFQTRRVAGGIDGGPFPNTPEESWLWLKDRLQAGDNISLAYDEEERAILIHGQPGGLAQWGSIGGTLADQTDLQTALNGKAAASHTHPISQVTNLQSTLNTKADLAHVVRHDVAQSLTSNPRVRAARNIGTLVTLSAELRGPDVHWQAATFTEWLWTLPSSFFIWDLSFTAFFNDIEEDFFFEAALLDSPEESQDPIWEDQNLVFGAGSLVATGTGSGVTLTVGVPIRLRIHASTPYSGSITGLQVHARGVWLG